jgi:hypothetical protein
MIKKAVSRSSGRRRVRGEDDKIPPIKTVATDLPLDVLRSMCFSMDLRVTPGRPIRGLHPCAPPSALRIRPAYAKNEWRARQSGRRSELRGAGPVPPGPAVAVRIATRARRLESQLRLVGLGVVDGEAP